LEHLWLIQLGLPVVLVVLAYFTGTFVERRHYHSIEEREAASIDLPLLVVRSLAADREVAQARLVAGSSVVSIDYFKRMLAGLRSIVGGRVAPYESLIDRARREALLRMKADAAGADLVLNVRIETSPIGASANEGSAVGSVEALAYGTAITFRR
jgi:uncharacterized protein YbjQ (UPF0145 family)